MNNCFESKAALTFLASCLLVLPTLCQAHFPALYGKVFIRSELAQQDERPHPPAVPPAPMDEADFDAYEQQVRAQELLDGPYAETLAESLSSIGHYHRERGDYRKAEDLYIRALHVVRVNDGLYSERQIPLLRDLLNLYHATGDLKALDDRYDYFFRLYGSGQPPYTALRKRASLEFLRWQRAAHCSGLDGGSYKRLVDLYLLNKQMLKSVAQTPNVDQAWQRELVLNQIRNLYLLLGVNNLTGSSLSAGSSAHTDPSVIVQQQLSNLQLTGLHIGRKLLQDLIAQSLQLGPIERASLHLELGDWYQWNELLRRAEEEYALVEQILLEAGELETLDQWLGAPVELPANDAFRQPNPRPSDAKPVVATVRYDISAKGYLSNVEVSTKKPEDASVGLRIKRMLKGTHFRPRFVSGHAEPTEKLTRQYQLIE